MSATPVPRVRRATRWFGAFVAIFGVLVVITNVHNKVFASHPTSRRVLFGGSTNFPGDFGRNVFSGSIAVGILILATSGALVLVGGRPGARIPGVVAVALGAFFVVSYRGGNNLLAASPASAAVLISAGLILLLAPVET